MKTYTEPTREIPITFEADVVVAGGGPAGLIAAVAARRTGAKKVLLIEKHGCLGGMMTVGSVMNLRQFSDLAGNLAIGGIGIEFAELLHSLGGTMHEPESESKFAPEKYGHLRQDPEITKYAAQIFCERSGVDILLHTAVVGAVKDGDNLIGVIIENKSGRQVMLGKVIIDATGDGDVIEHSGAAFLKEDGKNTQPMTLAFVLGNAAVGQWPTTLTKKQREFHLSVCDDPAIYPIPRRGMAMFPGFHENEIYFNATRCPGDATDAWDLTRAELTCRKQMMGIVEYLRKNMKGYENCYVKASGAQVGLRESRRLCGVYTLTEDDITSYKQFEDGVLKCNYCFDMHLPDRNGAFEHLEKGKCYSIPYRCLVPEKVDGLLAAGRNISATRKALSSLRVMCTAMALGHAAGIAAALAARDRVKPRDISIDELRNELLGQGAII